VKVTSNKRTLAGQKVHDLTVLIVVIFKDKIKQVSIRLYDVRLYLILRSIWRRFMYDFHSNYKAAIKRCLLFDSWMRGYRSFNISQTFFQQKMLVKHHNLKPRVLNISGQQYWNAYPCLDHV